MIVLLYTIGRMWGNSVIIAHTPNVKDGLSMLLNPYVLQDILNAAYRLLWTPGLRLHHAGALDVLGAAGATIDAQTGVAHIPVALTRLALSTAPASFALYDAYGRPTVQYGSGGLYAAPGSSAVAVLDSCTASARPSLTRDLVRATRLTDALPALDAASTCMVCTEVPPAVADLYRLRVVLRHTRKPVVTGAFEAETWAPMYQMLAAAAGGEEALAAKPRAVFDMCPRSPLTWDAAPLQNLLDCARHHVPAQIVPAPEAGVTAPVGLAGALAQHAAEVLGGIVIHQLAAPGAPVVWGGLPTVFDPRSGHPATGRIETAMLNGASVKVGAHLGLPTYTYLGVSDATRVDAQAGAESAVGLLLGALSGVDLLTGLGMLDAASTFSLEKLSFDAQWLQAARRAARGIAPGALPEALNVIRQVGHMGDFLTHPHTAAHFREALHLPAPAEDAESYRLPDDVAREIDAITLSAARPHGMDQLPDDGVV